MGLSKKLYGRFQRLSSRSKKAISLPLLALLMLMVALLAGPGLAAGQAGDSAALFVNVSLAESGAGSLAGYQDYIRRRPVLVNLALLGQADGRGTQSGRSLLLNLFPDVTFTAEPLIVNSPSPGELTWQGTIAGESAGTVLFTISGPAVAGTIQVDGRLFQLSYAGDGRHLITEAGAFDPMPEHPPVIIPAGDSGSSSPSGSEVEEGQGPNAIVDGDDGSVIDVLVAYTPAARANRGGTAAMKAHINLAVAETNQAYQNSQINTRLNLVMAAEVNYSESGDIITDLSRLRGKSDGYMDEVHGWRESVKADMVSLISVDNQYCGIAYMMTNLSNYSESFAFSVVHVTCATSYYSFGHELGHNMGSAHDRANAGAALFDFSFGYQAPNGAFRTIMAYNCSHGCPRVQHFSNPSVSYGGQPTGIDFDIDAFNSADNARSINNALVTVANFRVSSPPLQDPPLAPGNLAADPASFHEINLTWQNFAGNADGIAVERRPEGGGWHTIALIAPYQSSYDSFGLAGQSSYYYRVRAYNLGGYSSYSNTAGATTFPAPFFFFLPMLIR